METLSDNFISFWPYTFLAIIPAIALFFMIKNLRQNNPKTRDCPHCRAEIEVNEVECNSCHRKVIFA